METSSAICLTTVVFTVDEFKRQQALYKERAEVIN
jgi:hypothetical protein